MKPIVLGAALLFGAVSWASGESSFLGNESCKKCHLKVHKSWTATTHATAFGRLKADQQKKPDCLGCHTIGLGKKGGFDPSSPNPELQGVGCESCHGPGGDHVARMTKDKKADPGMAKPSEATCVACHNKNSPTFKGFDHKSFLAKGVHETTGE